VEVGTFIGENLEYSVKLEGINSEVTDIHLYQGWSKDYILVFTSAGLMFVFDGHPVTRRSDSIQPIKIFDTQHGKVVKAINLSVIFCDTVDVDFITVGEDKRMKAWRLFGTDEKITMEKIYESSDVFLSKPAGIELVKLREKYFIFVALEDGSLVRQEMKPKASGYSNVAFGSKQTIEGNGNAIIKMYSTDEYLVIEHSGGIVSLWSTKGSEICQYNKKSTASLFTSQPVLNKDDKNHKLILASTNLEIISPFESQCLEKFCGHQGEIKSLLSTGSNSLISTGLDGKVRHWSYSDGKAKEQTVEKIVAIKVISSPNKIDSNMEFLVLSSCGTLSHWIWDKETAREVSRISLETDRYELMDAVVLDENIFIVTASRNGKVSLFKVDFHFSVLSVEFINSNSLPAPPLGLKIHLEQDGKHNSGEFSVLYSTSSILYEMLARTTTNPRGPRPMLMTKRSFCTEDWETEPNFLKLIEEMSKQGIVFDKSKGQNNQDCFQKLHKRAFTLLYDSETVSSTFTIKDNGVLKCENHSLSTVNYQKLHEKIISGYCVIDETRIVTCAEDGKIKAWEVKKDDKILFKQVGEFIGHGPAFSAIELVEKKLIAGDTAGNVFCLEIL